MVYLGADHNGLKMKEELKNELRRHAIAFCDAAPFVSTAADYPSIAARVARFMKRDHGSTGLLLCGSGNGMVMAANRFRHIRAALAPSIRYAVKARTDEDANVLVLPAWWITRTEAIRIVRAWRTARPSRARRHQRRIAQLTLLHGG